MCFDGFEHRTEKLNKVVKIIYQLTALNLKNNGMIRIKNAS
jgi:hypothetical protein